MKLFMFPGQGSQFAGMGKDWAAQFQVAARAFEEASDGCGLNLRKLCFDGTDYDLQATEITQPVILTTSIAIFRALVERSEALSQEVPAALYAGHSLGEYSALVAAGFFDLGVAARLVRHRGKYMQEAVPEGMGGMSALIFKSGVDGEDLAKKLCNRIQDQTHKVLSVANYNSPEQIVVSGDAIAIEALGVESKNPEFSLRRALALAVSAPFHCSLMQKAADSLAPELEAAKKHVVNRKYIPNVSAKLSDLSKADRVVPDLVEQITGAVRWSDTIRCALGAGVVEAIEFGPKDVLSNLAKRIPLLKNGAEVFLKATPTHSWQAYQETKGDL